MKSGQSGHAEAVQVMFDPKITSFKQILFFYFKIHDPTTLNRQGNDSGTQYRSAIFYDSKLQKQEAIAVKEKVAQSKKWGTDKNIITQIIPLNYFWTAEEFHQKYLDKHQGGYTCHFERNIDF